MSAPVAPALEGPDPAQRESYFWRGTIRCSREGPIRVSGASSAMSAKPGNQRGGRVTDVNDDPLEWGHRIVNDTLAEGLREWLMPRHEPGERTP
jgi:hypothetical protein